MAANVNPFPHLKFQVVHEGRARLGGGGKPGKRELEIKKNPPLHVDGLRNAVSTLSSRWRELDRQRAALDLPTMPRGKPLLLLVEENSDVEFLRSAFGFEIISEEDHGFVLVSTEDLSFADFNETLQKFLEDKYGGGSAAKLYDILDLESSDQHLKRVLGTSLWERWPQIQDDANLIVDISIACTGAESIPDFPPKEDGEADDKFAARKTRYLDRHTHIMARWDDIQRQRESDIETLITEYNGSIFRITQTAGSGVFHMPDSFTVRACIPGKCFKDIAQNHPHIFRIAEAEDIESPNAGELHIGEVGAAVIMAPADDAPSVCVVDSGIQEGHVLLGPAVITTESRCFIPGASITDVADYVAPNGHGTRVAGAVLYPKTIPTAGLAVSLPCWIHNARVLNDKNKIPANLMPALYLDEAVRYFSDPARQKRARIFNHSINSIVPCRLVHMSTWAAAIDKLSHELDVLVIQSAGNISKNSVSAYLQNGISYPDYQLQELSRIRNPAQSLSALTVGSVAHTYWSQGQRASIAEKDQPSAFSPAGAGIWGSIKPDVVEYGGDFVVDRGPPTMAFPSVPVATELVRSTRHSPGAFSADDVGTSFAAPRVSNLAAVLANELPNEPCLLYRALIANSARWPAWADAAEDKLSVLQRIGYGIPDVNRATTNTEHRVTLVSSGMQEIPAREAHIYHIPIPRELRLPEYDCLIRIDVTLSYSAMPRRTRRHIAGYLATRLDWDVSKRGETFRSFRNRIFKDGDDGVRDGDVIFDWMIRDHVDHGVIEGMSRQNSTLQKDWCFIRANELPPDFCIAVVGHPGWDPSPETRAKYSLAISFEAVNEDLRVYQPIRAAVEAQVPVEVQQRVEVPAEL